MATEQNRNTERERKTGRAGIRILLASVFFLASCNVLPTPTPTPFRDPNAPQPPAAPLINTAQPAPLGSQESVYVCVQKISGNTDIKKGTIKLMAVPQSASAPGTHVPDFDTRGSTVLRDDDVILGPAGFGFLGLGDPNCNAFPTVTPASPLK